MAAVVCHDQLFNRPALEVTSETHRFHNADADQCQINRIGSRSCVAALYFAYGDSLLSIAMLPVQSSVAQDTIRRANASRAGTFSVRKSQ